jgi:hypothetical protein
MPARFSKEAVQMRPASRQIRTRSAASHGRASERVVDTQSVDTKSTLFPHTAAPISFAQCDFREICSTPFLGGLALLAAICRPQRKSQHQAHQEAHHEPFPAVPVRPCLVRVRPPGRAAKELR